MVAVKLKKIACVCGRVAVVTDREARWSDLARKAYDFLTLAAVDPVCRQCGRPVKLPTAEALQEDQTSFDHLLALADPATLARHGRLDQLQAAQGDVSRLRDQYRDTQPEFWALAVAWEALRFAWYVVAGDQGSAAAKLALVEEAIKDWKSLAQEGS